MANNLIYDVGMHNGNDTAFYLACGFQVVAIEADPDLAEAGRRRFAEALVAKKLTILNIGITEHESVAEFWINEGRSQMNSFSQALTARGGEPCHPISIPCRRLDTVFSEHGIPYYIKIDIEGNDIICCNQIDPETKPAYISVEMSQIELLFKLRDLGYNRFKLMMQLDLQPIEAGSTPFPVSILRTLFRIANYRKDKRGLPLRVLRTTSSKILKLAQAMGCSNPGVWKNAWPFQSKRKPEWNFLEGCSGSFGEDLPGEWMSWKEIEQIWHRDLREFEKLGLEYWCDLHASVSV